MVEEVDEGEEKREGQYTYRRIDDGERGRGGKMESGVGKGGI